MVRVIAPPPRGFTTRAAGEAFERGNRPSGWDLGGDGVSRDGCGHYTTGRRKK